MHSVGYINLPLPVPSSSSSPPPLMGSGGVRGARVGDISDNDRADSNLPSSSFSKGCMFLEKRKTMASPPPPPSDSNPSHFKPLKKSPRSSSKKSPSSLPSAAFSSSVRDKKDASPQQQWKKHEYGCSTDNSKTIRIPWKQKNATDDIHKTTYFDKKDRDNSLSATTSAPTVSEQHTVLSLSTLTTKAVKIADNQEKIVQFNRRVRIRKIRMLDDMPIEEIESTYYSNEEMVDLRNSLRAMIRVLVQDVGLGLGSDNGNYDNNNVTHATHHNDNNSSSDCDSDDGTSDCYDDDVFCIRGLEHEFPEGKFRRRQNKRISRGVVFQEQRLQRAFCNHNNHDTAATNAGDDAADGDADIICEDPVMAIAELYRMESMPALQHALDTAKQDEFVANRIYAAAAAAAASTSTSSLEGDDDGANAYCDDDDLISL